MIFNQCFLMFVLRRPFFAGKRTGGFSFPVKFGNFYIPFIYTEPNIAFSF